MDHVVFFCCSAVRLSNLVQTLQWGRRYIMVYHGKPATTRLTIGLLFSLHFSRVKKKITLAKVVYGVFIAGEKNIRTFITVVWLQ